MSLARQKYERGDDVWIVQLPTDYEEVLIPTFAVMNVTVSEHDFRESLDSFVYRLGGTTRSLGWIEQRCLMGTVDVARQAVTKYIDKYAGQVSGGFRAFSSLDEIVGDLLG